MLKSNPAAIYNIISVIGYILAALCFAGSIGIFFAMDIPRVYEYLTGKKERKGIENMRSQNVEESAQSTTLIEQGNVINNTENKPHLFDPNATDLIGFESTLPIQPKVGLSQNDSEYESTSLIGSVGKFVIVKNEMIIHTEEVL